MPLKQINEFSSKFTNLTISQQEELQFAFKDLQDSLDTTSLTTSLELLKRRPDQDLPIPQVTSTPTIRGAILEWDPLPDQRVSFFEIDVADQNNFSSFVTTTTFGLSAIIDGLTFTKFARVRGIRKDETVTAYSEAVQISPEAFEINTHTDEDFYVRIIGTDENTVLGGEGSFLEFTPINPEGQSMVWGMISTYADPAVAMYGIDSINARVYLRIIDTDGSVVSDEVIWKHSISEYFNTQAIGPFTINHPELNQSVELRVTVQDETGTAADNSQVQWVHLNVFELGVE